MGKLILLSLVFGTLLAPLAAAREREPARALRRVVVYFILFNLCYAFAVLIVYPRV
jgi:hypothetical protein